MDAGSSSGTKSDVRSKNIYLKADCYIKGAIL